ncbi:ABC transporter ATP-binding protein [Rothia uropygialis]|uniref:ABC transporter ATP-binding protein n=1 Tax=Kocuria sp. 36 TaxID=1415402 RepID=UPI001930F2B0|nr:ABC transporter ATP-binding protein [Kocuria sp. 36]
MASTHPTERAQEARRKAASVRFHSVGKSFPGSRRGTAGSEVLRDVTFTAEPGEIVAVLGPSGCGKSTLLRAAAGLDTASAGSVTIDGTPVREIDPRCAVGFQEPRLLPWRSVTDNVVLGLPKNASKNGGRKRVAELIDLVGLGEHASHRPGEVSGGMAQRASLARALARNPRVLLLDEPFGALDALTRLKMQDLLLDIHGQDPTTVLLVTHDVDEALYLSDRVVILGRTAPGVPAGIVESIEVGLPRPRSREDAQLVRMRGHLLGLLGVDTTAHEAFRDV